MDALLSCGCRLGLDGVAVPTLLLDLVLILFSGSDLVFSEVLVPSVLALSLVLDLAKENPRSNSQRQTDESNRGLLLPRSSPRRRKPLRGPIR